MNPPTFLAGLSTTYGVLNPIPQSSKLWQDVYGGNPNGDAAKMRQYCRELNDYYIQYLSNRQKVDDAYNNVQSYVSACRNYGISMLNEAGWVDLTIMPPACYETLNLVKTLIRDFNVQNREGKLLDYYVILANNEDYYAEKRDQLARAAKSPALQSASVSVGELPTYAKICKSIDSLLNNSSGFADGVKGYSPDESGGVFEKLIVPIQSVIEGRRSALTWDYSIEGGQAKIWGVGGVVSGAVVIPGEFEGCPVVELGDYLFTGSGMTSVVIPETVTKIGNCAFSGCRQLGAVRIPAKVASIGEWAFAGCDVLMKIEVVAGNAAYRAVNGLLFAKGGTDPIAGIGGDVTVPAGVKRIGTQLFYERKLGSVALPPGVVEIGDRAFAYSTLTEITIPSSVTTIAGDAFYSCDRLVTVYVDHGDDFRVRELLRNTGAYLSRITIVSEFTETVDGVEWSYGTMNGEAVVTSIPRKPEGESYGKVVVPSKLGGLAVTAIGNSVFVWRSDITEVVIPQGVRSIGEFAFNSSPSIKTVTLPKSVTRIDNLAFAYSSLTTVRTAPGDAARMKALMTKGGLSVSVNWVEADDPSERPEIIVAPIDGAVPQGRYMVLNLVEVLGLEIPSDVDYAAGDKVTVKGEGLAKGLKVVATPVYEDPEAKKKVIKDYVYTIEGVPTETVDFDTQTMYARVSVTYKDKTKTADGTGKAESLQPVGLSVVPQEPHVLTAGVLNEVYEPVDIAELWPDVADAKVNPKDWTFKGWPAGIKYNATTKDASWSYKNGKETVKTNAAPYTVYGQPTKAGEFPITATWKHKLADGKTTVSETFSAVLTVWGDDGKAEFRYKDRAYVETTAEPLTDVKSVSGLPSGIKFNKTDGSHYGTPTKAGVFAVTVTKTDNSKETFLWKVEPGENEGILDGIGWKAADSAVTVMQGVIRGWDVEMPEGAKVTASGLPAGLKLAQDKATKAWTLAGTPTKAGNYVVTLKTVRNGVTVNERISIIVEPNVWTGGWYGVQDDPDDADASLLAEVKVSANGTVKLVYTEASTNYNAKGAVQSAVRKTTVTVKNLDADGTTATLTLPKDKKDPLSQDRICVLDFKKGELKVDGTATMRLLDMDVDVSWPEVLTVVLEETDGGVTNAYGYVTATYNAKKGSFALAGKLWDGTAVKGTCYALADGCISPVLITDKAKNAVTVTLGSADGDLRVIVRENGELVPVGRKVPNGYEPLSGSFAAGELKSKKFNMMSGATQLVVLTGRDGEGAVATRVLDVPEKERKASVSAQGLVKFTITDAEGWKWACDLLPVDNGGETQFRGIATGTKKNEPTQVCPVWAE